MHGVTFHSFIHTAAELQCINNADRKEAAVWDGKMETMQIFTLQLNLKYALSVNKAHRKQV